MKAKKICDDPTNVSLTMLCKLASIAAHAKEMLSPKGHAYDRMALEQLLDDPQIVEWLVAMGPFVPVKR